MISLHSRDCMLLRFWLKIERGFVPLDLPITLISNYDVFQEQISFLDLLARHKVSINFQTQIRLSNWRNSISSENRI